VKNVYSKYSSAWPVDSGSLSENSISDTHIDGLSKRPFINDTPKPKISSDIVINSGSDDDELYSSIN
jgi:hypothetical protein